jgi:hypothetical protein
MRRQFIAFHFERRSLCAGDGDFGMSAHPTTASAGSEDEAVGGGFGDYWRVVSSARDSASGQVNQRQQASLRG